MSATLTAAPAETDPFDAKEQDIPKGFTLCGEFVGFRQQMNADKTRAFLFVTVDCGDGPDDRIEFIDGIEGLQEYMTLKRGDMIAFRARVSARLNRGVAAVSISRARPRK